MEFVEAMKKAGKICGAYEQCMDCPLRNKGNGCCTVRFSFNCDFEKIEKIISEWKSPVDWSQVKVDTPILVWDSGSEKNFKRYFAKYEAGKVYAWNSGCTSWSAEVTVPWQYVKLAEVENDER